MIGVDKKALGPAKVPGSVCMRQSLDAQGDERRELTSLRVQERTEAPSPGHHYGVCGYNDTFVIDRSDTKKIPTLSD